MVETLVDVSASPSTNLKFVYGGEGRRSPWVACVAPPRLGLAGPTGRPERFCSGGIFILADALPPYNQFKDDTLVLRLNRFCRFTL